MLSNKREAKLREEELAAMKEEVAGKNPYLVKRGRAVPEFGYTDLGVDEDVHERFKKGGSSSRPGSRNGG
jgi:hypothetical protein